MPDCIFCKIAQGKIPANIVWEDENALAFRDINPQAPTHVIFIPRRHAETFSDVGSSRADFASSLIKGIKEVAEAEKLDGGYRIISNNGPEAGQEVPHLHVHLLGGKNLGPMLAL